MILLQREYSLDYWDVWVLFLPSLRNSMQWEKASTLGEHMNMPWSPFASHLAWERWYTPYLFGQKVSISTLESNFLCSIGWFPRCHVNMKWSFIWLEYRNILHLRDCIRIAENLSLEPLQIYGAFTSKQWPSPDSLLYIWCHFVTRKKVRTLWGHKNYLPLFIK